MGAEATAAASPRRARIALFDNLKGMLIILVVFGHIAHPIHNDNAALSAAFDIIYLFHMPLFVLTSGLFAKKSTTRRGKECSIKIISVGFALLVRHHRAMRRPLSVERVTGTDLHAFFVSRLFL